MNIFYSEVDKNLKTELRARGESFRNRDNDSLNYMLSKIANVEISAYQTTSSKSILVGRLGGNTVREGRYLPTGPDGYLMSNRQYERSEIAFNSVTGQASLSGSTWTDKSTRTGPFITAVDVSIGDHSMGLLNKASFRAIIPNADRDLDTFEETWMRPGRYARIEIVHPSTAIASGVNTNGLLTSLVIPNREKLKSLYPDWNIQELEQEAREMRKFVFEGLITSFSFSYTKDGTIEVDISLTGTSNVYTNLSMYIDSAKAGTAEADSGTATAATIPDTSSKEFYGILYDRFEELIKQFKAADPAAPNLTKFLIPYIDAKLPAPTATDHFILKGEQFPSFVTIPPSTPGVVTIPSTPVSLANDSRYITLGGLIQHINSYVLSKLPGAQIICTDIECFSVYYALMVSSNPDEILFLPRNPNVTAPPPAITPQDYNVYGNLVYYQDVIKQLDDNSVNSAELKQKGLFKEWPGVYEKSPDGSGKIYPSRIFINLETIERLINDLSQKNTASFSVSVFISKLCELILDASGNSINLALVTYPYDTSKLFLTDSKYVRTTKVIPFSVPMFANHGYGTIVHDFSFESKLPDSVKNLSYVLNSSSDVSEEDIAPYLNFMYNGKNVDAVNKILARYNRQHVQASKELLDAKIKFGQSPDVPSVRAELNKALKKYIQYPTDDIKNTNLLTAPLFPFTVNFTIDGINGFRYGDVLTFDGLPTKYRVNTVFSIISINHTVSNQGEWKTQITCIQRPSIE